MSTEYFAQVGSFVLDLYDSSFKKRVTFSLPTAIAAPFANRLIREILGPDAQSATREPWYMIIPRFRDDDSESFQRAPLPVGPTSLYGQCYLPESEAGPPVSLHPESLISYFIAQLVEFDQVMYEGEYSVDDIFLAWARFLTNVGMERGHLNREDGPFLYKVDVSRKEVRSISSDLFPPGAYQVEGVFQLPPLEKDRERTVFHKVPSEPLAIRTNESFGPTQRRGMGKPGEGRVLMRSDVYHILRDTLPLSDTVEDGGYLLGTPYRQAGSPEDEEAEDFRWQLEITDIVKAESAWGQPGLLLFTGDSWSQMNRRRDRDYPDKKMVSWFHTHLFEASDSFGLSGLDQDLHRRFLTKPWQVAILLNIDAFGARTIRCFQRGPEGDLVESTFEVFDPASQITDAEQA